MSRLLLSAERQSLPETLAPSGSRQVEVPDAPRCTEEAEPLAAVLGEDAEDGGGEEEVQNGACLCG